MLSAQNIQSKLGEGITPEAFIEKMRPEYREKFEKWYQSFTWEDHNRAALTPLQERDDLRCAIIAGDWCGDVHPNLGPVLETMKEAAIPVEMFVLEDHDDVMDHFLTMGGRSVPKVILTDKEGHVLFTWGPRPAYIQEPMLLFKHKNMEPDEPRYEEEKLAAYQEIKARYGNNADYQKLIVYELTNQLLQL
ncbi:thioredoxin family protein [Bacillus piscicola]|uniref:thioredoxin family protein n=1 Tax=Bacillus piscicola TaxID=1632684 RepID=UPI001F09C9E9|nr:thioredoxin family protein [Bacillus piscicola]